MYTRFSGCVYVYYIYVHYTNSFFFVFAMISQYHTLDSRQPTLHHRRKNIIKTVFQQYVLYSTYVYGLFSTVVFSFDFLSYYYVFITRGRQRFTVRRRSLSLVRLHYL